MNYVSNCCGALVDEGGRCMSCKEMCKREYVIEEEIPQFKGTIDKLNKI